jgi:hypothetical protein
MAGEIEESALNLRQPHSHILIFPCSCEEWGTYLEQKSVQKRTAICDCEQSFRLRAAKSLKPSTSKWREACLYVSRDGYFET